MLLNEQFENTVASMPEKTALIFEGQRYTYGQLHHDARRCASYLHSQGVERGDRVAVFMDNAPEVIVSVYAVLQIGATFMLLNSQTKAEKLNYILNDARPVALITQASLQSVYTAAAFKATSLKSIVVLGLSDNEQTQVHVTSFASALREVNDNYIDQQTIDQDLAAIIYTSGSTGDPKGVMLTHLNMVSACNSVSSYLGLCPDDRLLCVLPLAFDYGLYQVLMAFKHGATVVLEKSFAFPVKILGTMARERVTIFPGVPTIFSLLMGLNGISRYDLSALRMITNTAAALSQQHIADLRNLFPQACLFSMYGLTECKRVTYLPPEQLNTRPTSVGRGMPNEEIWLVDENDKRLPNGSTGELVIRGSHVMRGYWEKPEETAKRLKPSAIPGEMLLYSGDIFRTDEEGYLYFIARKDDVIKSRGEKVSPREVENVLYSLDGVKEAAVIGVPDPVFGQAVKAFIALRPGHNYSEREVIKYCLAHLENFMAPKYVEFVQALPITDTGKIKKTGLA